MVPGCWPFIFMLDEECVAPCWWGWPSRALTYGPGSLSDLPVIGGGVSVGVSVVVCDGHVVQPVVLWGERAGVGQAVGLVGESV